MVRGLAAPLSVSLCLDEAVQASQSQLPFSTLGVQHRPYITYVKAAAYEHSFTMPGWLPDQGRRRRQPTLASCIHPPVSPSGREAYKDIRASASITRTKRPRRAKSRTWSGDKHHVSSLVVRRVVMTLPTSATTAIDTLTIDHYNCG